MTWVYALQFVEPLDDPADAGEALAAILLLDGVLGARVLPAGGGKPLRLQALFEDASVDDAALPDGVRRVRVPPGLWSALARRK